MKSKIKISIIASILGFSSCFIGTFNDFGMSYNGRSMGVLDWEYVRANPSYNLVSDSDLKAKNTKELLQNLGLVVMIAGFISMVYFINKKEKSDSEDRKNVKI